MKPREPARSGYCSDCGEPCEGKWEDIGIGPYEFWGRRGNDVQWVEQSTCCEGEILDYKPTKYRVIGDDWTPCELFDSEAQAESFAKRNGRELGSYHIEEKP